MNQFVTLLNVILDNWQTAVSYLVASGAVAVAVQFLKKHYGLEQRIKVLGMEAKKFILLLPALFAFVFSIADTWLSWGITGNIANYVPQLETVLPYVTLLAVFIHRFSVSGTWSRLSKLLQDAKNYNTNKIASIPPTPPTTPPVNLV